MTQPVILEGTGLHTGAPARVVLRRTGDEPVRLGFGAIDATVEELEVVSTERATTVAHRHHPEPRLQTVEHAMAAFAGLGLRRGVHLRADGPELPLLDGGAAAWCDALAKLDVAPVPPLLRVASAAVVEVGTSRYEFSPGEGVELDVHFELDDPRIEPAASWKGDPRDFRERIAPARTFALARDLEELARRGLARHVDPRSVVLVMPDAIHHAGRPFSADEPARHKLLDLLGDLYLHGGPPLGRIRAHRPGHAANARALVEAARRGVVVRSR